MDTSEKIDKIAPAFLRAQQQMGAARKSSTNPHFRSKYADLNSVMDAVLPALHDNDISVSQDELIDDQDFCIVMTTLVHAPSGQWLKGHARVFYGKRDPQGSGSALTYTKRYGLQMICALPTEDDDGNSAMPSPEERKLQQALSRLRSAVKASGATAEDLKARCGGKSANQLTVDEINTLVAELNNG